MPSYNQLLARKEWREKSIEILKRDNYTCQRCGVNVKNRLATNRSIHLEQALKQVDPSYELVNTRDNRNIRLRFTDSHSGIILKSPHTIQTLYKAEDIFLIFQTAKKSFIQYPFKATMGKVNFNMGIHQEIEQDGILTVLRSYLKKDTSIDVDLEGIYLVKEAVAKKTVYSKNYNIMEVHHKCYRKGIEIWEHPDEEYVTLCNICHDIVHENQEIPFFDERGRFISDLEKCSRCSGKGYIPEYRHVENGRCFKCNGRGSIEPLGFG